MVTKSTAGMKEFVLQVCAHCPLLKFLPCKMGGWTGILTTGGHTPSLPDKHDWLHRAIRYSYGSIRQLHINSGPKFTDSSLKKKAIDIITDIPQREERPVTSWSSQTHQEGKKDKSHHDNDRHTKRQQNRQSHHHHIHTQSHQDRHTKTGREAISRMEEWPVTDTPRKGKNTITPQQSLPVMYSSTATIHHGRKSPKNIHFTRYAIKKTKQKKQVQHPLHSTTHIHNLSNVIWHPSPPPPPLPHPQKKYIASIPHEIQPNKRPLTQICQTTTNPPPHHYPPPSPACRLSPPPPLLPTPPATDSHNVWNTQVHHKRKVHMTLDPSHALSVTTNPHFHLVFHVSVHICLAGLLVILTYIAVLLTYYTVLLTY